MFAKRIIFGVLLLFSLRLSAQQCGTILTQEQEKFINEILQNREQRGARVKSVNVKIPLKIHSVRRDDGSGGLTETQLATILNRLNSYYANADIEFTILGTVHYINNSDFFDFNTNDEGAVSISGDTPGTINIYFFNSISSSGSPLCGYTRFPPSADRVFVAYGCVSGNSLTLEHELGHYFTLFHTHGKTNTGSTDELVNASNCNTAGDNICDTPADPNLSGKVSNCVYTGTDKDANGQIYNPQVANIMSYAPDGCQNLFTQGQYDRIRNGFENGRSYLNFVAEGFTANFLADERKKCIGNTVNFTLIGFGVAERIWEFPGGTPSTSTAVNPSVSYSQGGVYKVKLTATAGDGQQVVVEKNAYITIIDPLAEAISQETFANFNNGIPDFFQIENPDQGYTFENSDEDASDNPGSGSIFVNNFDYFTENKGNNDIFSLPYYDNAGIAKYNISFDVAYAYRPGGFNGEFITTDVHDTLAFNITTMCGQAPKTIWQQGGNSLSTVPASETPFYPVLPSQWKKISVEYTVRNGEQFALFQFLSKSYNGNNVFVDNISIMPDYTVNTPSNFRASNISSTGVTLRWLDNSVNELNFVIERSDNEGDFETIASLPSNTLSYVDSEIEPGNLYHYRIYAQGSGDNRSDYDGPVLVDDLITGIEGKDQLSASVKVHPNPAKEYFIVEINNNITGPIDVNLSTTHGVQVFGNSSLKENGEKEINIDTHLLGPGVYVLAINMAGRRVYKKIMIK